MLSRFEQGRPVVSPTMISVAHFLPDPPVSLSRDHLVIGGSDTSGLGRPPVDLW